MKTNKQDKTVVLSKRKQIREYENKKDTAIGMKIKAEKEITGANEKLRALRSSR